MKANVYLSRMGLTPSTTKPSNKDTPSTTKPSNKDRASPA